MAVLTREEVETLLTTTETFRSERTISTTGTDKFCEAICAFTNDMPDSRKKGYLFVGAYDDGRRSGLKVSDKLLKDLSAIRSDGNILPMPVMNVSAAKSALKSALKDVGEARKLNILTVFDMIFKNNDIQISAIVSAISVSRRSVSEYLDVLKSVGVLAREGGAHGGRWKITSPK